MLAESPWRLPHDIEAAAEALVRAYLDSPIRPRLSAATSHHWDRLIDQWAEDEDLPLFVRKPSVGKGRCLTHSTTGRNLVPSDNSPAHWVVAMAFTRGEDFTIEDLRRELAGDRIPVAMVLNKAERTAAYLKCPLAKLDPSPNQLKWKVDHIDGVGMNQKGSIQEMAINDLKRHFRKLMKISNIILIPSILKGLGDMPVFLEHLKKEKAKASLTSV